MDNNATNLPINDETEIEAIAPEQEATHRWEFKPRQAPKWGVVEKRGLVVGRAPNQKIIPPDEVYYLASLGCSIREMATWFGVTESTLKYNFADYIDKGFENTKQKLRQAQIKAAMSGNVTMLIWLGKNMLGQAENPTNTDNDKILPWTD